MGAETEKRDWSTFNPGYVWGLISNNLIATCFDTPSKPPAPLAPRVWVGDWVGVRKVEDEVKDEGLGPWGLK